jgi:hypothetical protein
MTESSGLVLVWRILQVVVDVPITYWICEALHSSPSPDRVEIWIFIFIVTMWGFANLLDDLRRLMEVW